MLGGEKCLMVAVLEQAVIDLQSPRCAVRRQARAWLFARGARAEHVFSFARICEEFGRSPVSARGRILATSAANSEVLHEVQEREQPGQPDVAVPAG
jgi:hypothetical protein